MLYHLYLSVSDTLTHLNFQQVSLLVLTIVAFGFFCLRGFGSRQNY